MSVAIVTGSGGLTGSDALAAHHTPRIDDHRWWISDLSAFRADYPEWEPAYDLGSTLREIHDRNAERWLADADPAARAAA